MKRSRFTREQIIATRRGNDAAAKAAAQAREQG
jgi:hypothetical protein